MIMWTVLTWTLSPIAIVLFKFTGVAIASAVIASTSIVTVWMLKKYVKINFLDQIWRQLAASIVMLVVLFLTRNLWQTSLIRIFLSVILGAIVYTIGIFSFGYKKVMFEVGSLGIHRK